MNDGTQRPQSNPIIEWWDTWTNTTPAVTRISLIVLVICYIFSWFIDLDGTLSNIPSFSIENFEFPYRFVLSPFVGNSLLDVIFLLFFYPMMASMQERRQGSSAFMFFLIILTVATNILFTIICFILWAAGDDQALVI